MSTLTRSITAVLSTPVRVISMTGADLEESFRIAYAMLDEADLANIKAASPVVPDALRNGLELRCAQLQAEMTKRQEEPAMQLRAYNVRDNRVRWGSRLSA